jgi:hypothetical protein
MCVGCHALELLFLASLLSIGSETQGISASSTNITRLFYDKNNSKTFLASASWPAGSCSRDSRDFSENSTNVTAYVWRCNADQQVMRTDCYDPLCLICSDRATPLSAVETVGGIFVFKCGLYAPTVEHTAATLFSATTFNESSPCVESDPVHFKLALQVCVPAISTFARADCCDGNLITRWGCADPTCRNCSTVGTAVPYRPPDLACRRGSILEQPLPCPAAAAPRAAFRVVQRACLWFAGHAALPQLRIAPTDSDALPEDSGLTFDAELLPREDAAEPNRTGVAPRLLGAASAPGRCGAARFTDLRIDAAGAYLLRVWATLANGAQVEVARAPVVVLHGAPHRLAITSQPAGFKAGRPFKFQPEVAVVDVGGNRVATGAPDVWAQCLPAACVLTLAYRPVPAAQQPAAGGAAAFRGLGVQGRVWPAVLRFYAAGLPAVNSDVFSVADAPYRVQIVAQPPAVVLAGAGFCVRAEVQAKNEQPFAWFDGPAPASVAAALYRQAIPLSPTH